MSARAASAGRVSARAAERERTLTRRELTVALAARQMLLARERLDPAEAIARLTPLQGQHPAAGYIGLAARLEGFRRADLEHAIEAGRVFKSTLMRRTLHLSSAAEHPAYAQLARQGWLRTWRKRYAGLEEEQVRRELRAFFRRPRGNDEIRARVPAYIGEVGNEWEAVWFARALLPLLQLPPAGFYEDRRRPRFAVLPGRLPTPQAAAALVLRRYLAAFGPASLRDVSAWAGAPQADFAPALQRVRTVSYRDENGIELLDLPGQPLPPAGTPLPVRLLGHWDQQLLAHADRERILPRELGPVGITLSGSPTVTVDGRVAASWELTREDGRALVTVTPHAEVPRAARAEIQAEAERTLGACEPEAARIDVIWSA